MTSARKKYAELLALTQLFLLREYPLTNTRTVSPDSFRFFNGTASVFPVVHQEPTRPSPPLSQPTRLPPLPPSPTTPARKSPPPSPAVQTIKQSAQTPLQIPPTPPPPQPEPPSYAKHKLLLEPIAEQPTPPADRGWWTFFSTLFPEVPLCSSIPSDAQARRAQQVWQEKKKNPSVILLSFTSDKKEEEFLHKLATAISQRLALAKVLAASALEKEKGWGAVLSSPTLRLVVASGYDFYLQPGLKPFYREIPDKSQHFLGTVPLLLLSDFSLYLQTPALKIVLWRAICSALAPTNVNEHPVLSPLTT